MASTCFTLLFFACVACTFYGGGAQGCKAASGIGAVSLIQHQVATFTQGHSGVGSAVERRGAIPTGKKIGILLRGQTFRAQYVGGQHFDKTPCDGYVESLQMNYTRTLLEEVIIPFENYGNEVQIVSTAQPCEMNSKIADVFLHRSVEFTTLTPDNQSQDLLQAFAVFAQHYGGVANVANMLDYVLVVRHDLQWLEDITHWENDFDAFSFLARCNPEASAAVGGQNCVHDIAHWMPAKLFPVFYATAGHVWRIEGHKTFTGNRLQPLDCFVEDGHGCYYPMQEALFNHSKSASISFLTSVQFAPKHWNPLVNLGRVGLGKKEKSQSVRKTRMNERAAETAAKIAATKAHWAEKAACPNWCDTLAEELHAKEDLRTEAQELAEKCTWAPCTGCPNFKDKCPPATPQCATNYGNISACCGQSYHDDFDSSKKHVCPEALPLCVGYVPGRTLGICQGEPSDDTDVADVDSSLNTKEEPSFKDAMYDAIDGLVKKAVGCT